jgi:hypothetical protein
MKARPLSDINALLAASPEEAAGLLAAGGWEGVSALSACMGLACLTGDEARFTELLEQDPGLLGQACGNWNMGKWIGSRASFVEGMRPFEVALVAGHPGLCLKMLEVPGFVLGDTVAGHSHYGVFFYGLGDGLAQRAPPPEAVALFLALHQKGLPVQVLGSANALPVAILVYASTTGSGKLPFFKECIAGLDMASLPFMEPAAATEFQEKWANMEQSALWLSSPPDVKNRLLSGQIVESRFPHLLDAVADWLLEAGWRDPAFLETLRTHRPGPFSLYEKTLIEEGVETSKPSLSGASRLRL